MLRACWLLPAILALFYPLSVLGKELCQEMLLQPLNPWAAPSVAGAAGEQWEWECRHGVAQGETTPFAPGESH